MTAAHAAAEVRTDAASGVLARNRRAVAMRRLAAILLRALAARVKQVLLIEDLALSGRGARATAPRAERVAELEAGAGAGGATTLGAKARPPFAILDAASPRRAPCSLNRLRVVV